MLDNRDFPEGMPFEVFGMMRFAFHNVDLQLVEIRAFLPKQHFHAQVNQTWYPPYHPEGYAVTTPSSALDYFYWPTPNGQKVAIFLEESGLPFTAHPVNISKGEQFAAEFTRISPNQRI
nr:glutathione S-transferase [Tanacetum cinerariifolium]